MHKRFVALTDIYREPGDKQAEIDDVESMIRLLLYANDLDIEGLIATSSFCYKKGGTDKEKRVILDIIDAYEKVLPNLRVHAEGYPDAEYLRSVTRHGVTGFGAKLGKGFGEERLNDNEGVQLIVDTLDKDDERPVWFGLWGGCNTLAQAIWYLWKSRPADEFDRLIRKVRVYGISDQDRAGIWLRRQFGERLFYVVSPSNGRGVMILNGMGFMGATWTGMCWDGYSMGKIKSVAKDFAAADRDLVVPEWLEAHICARGTYGATYPLPTAAMEGDTPTYLGLIENGLNDLEHPDWGGWGGRYELGIPQKAPLFGSRETHPIWTDTADTFTGRNGQTVTNGVCTLYRWREAVQNDFAARMAWTDCANYADANHAPVVALNGPTDRTVACGQRCVLSVAGTLDPDGDELTFRWFNYQEAGSLKSVVPVEGANMAEASFVAPGVPCTLHFIAEVTDCGTPAMTRYARVIVHVKK